MTYSVERQLVNGVWVTDVVEEGGGGSQTLAQTLALGNDANNLQIKNVAEGTLGDDVATVSQLGEGLPTGWTQAGDPADVDTQGGDFRSSGLVTANQFVFDGSVSRIFSGFNTPLGFDFGLDTLYLRTNGQAWIKTGAGVNDWTQFGGTPAAAINVVRVPIAFDDAGLSPVTYAITAVGVDPANTFAVAGNHAAEFIAGQKVTVTGSTLNDGDYHIVSAVFGAVTVITVAEAVPDATADGTVTTVTGVAVYTPAVGDIVIASLVTVSVTTAWDGSGTPTLWLFQSGSSDYTNSIVNTSAVDLTVEDADVTTDGNGTITQGRRFSTSTAIPWRMLSTAPLRIGYDDASGADPGSSQGEGEVVVVVQSA